MVKTRSGKSTDRVEALCDIEDPILFQAVLTRLKSILDEYAWRSIVFRLTGLSPRALIVAIAAGELYVHELNARRLQWMLRGPNPYILKHPSMMREVRELNLHGDRDHELDPSPPLHHLTSLRKLEWCSSVLLPDDAFSLLRQHVTGLQDLHVETERLSPPMLNDILQMTNLTSLELHYLDCIAFPPMDNLFKLKDLTISDRLCDNHQVIVSPETLRGLTRLESLELDLQVSDDLAMAIPALFPLLHWLSVDRARISENAVTLLESHYEDKEGFEFEIWD